VLLHGKSPSDIYLKEEIVPAIDTVLKGRAERSVEVAMGLLPLEELPSVTTSEKLIARNEMITLALHLTVTRRTRGYRYRVVKIIEVPNEARAER
jgi:hypothetical protein